MKQREGWALIDHKASPGLSEDLAISRGFDPTQLKEGTRFEASVLTCSHCKTSQIKNPLRLRERNYCWKCGGHYICDLCSAKTREPDYVHNPFERIIDRVNDDAYKGTLSASSYLINP